MVVEIVLVISDEIVQSALCFYQYNLPQNDYNIQKSYTFWVPVSSEVSLPNAVPVFLQV